MEVVNKNKKLAIQTVEKFLLDKGFSDVRKLAEEYPYSLYDIEYRKANKKKFVIIRFTSTKTKFFSLPYNKIKFCNDYSDDVKIALVTDINGLPCVYWYTIGELNGMNKMINSITYSVGGE